MTETASLLREVARLHVQAQREMVACCHGTTLTQCTILTAIGQDGKINLAEICRRTGREKSWTSRAVDSLVAKGLLQKESATTDKRNLLISFTSAGQDRLKELNQILNHHANQILNCVPVEDLACVRKALELLQSAYLSLKN